jgi:hypothetical protein
MGMEQRFAWGISGEFDVRRGGCSVILQGDCAVGSREKRIFCFATFWLMIRSWNSEDVECKQCFSGG